MYAERVASERKKYHTIPKHIYEIKITTTNGGGLCPRPGMGTAVQGLRLCKRSLHCFASSRSRSLSLSNHIHMQNESNNTMAESNDANTERDIITTTKTTTTGAETETVSEQEAASAGDRRQQ